MEIIIIILGLPLLFVGYKIGVGKLLYRDRWYKSFFFWWFRLVSLGGISATMKDENYLATLGVFLFIGFIWANALDMIYKKIMNIKDGITEPFKGKNEDEINNEKILDLEDEIKNTRKDIHTQNRIKALEEELENLKNPPPSMPPKIEEVKTEPIKKELKIDPVIEQNKTELKSVLSKLGF